MVGASAPCLHPPSGKLERNSEEMTGLELWVALVLVLRLMCAPARGVGGGVVLPGGPRIPGGSLYTGTKQDLCATRKKWSETVKR